MAMAMALAMIKTMNNATDPFLIRPKLTARIVQDVHTGEPCAINCEHENGAKTSISMQKIGKLAINQLRQELTVPGTQTKGAE
jgi:hypothetical protein